MSPMPLVLAKWAPHPPVSGRFLIGRHLPKEGLAVPAVVILSGFLDCLVLGVSVEDSQALPLDLCSPLLTDGVDV